MANSLNLQCNDINSCNNLTIILNDNDNLIYFNNNNTGNTVNIIATQNSNIQLFCNQGFYNTFKFMQINLGKY